MVIQKLAYALILITFIFQSDDAYSQYCPSRIAAIPGDLSDKSAAIIVGVYNKLGCPLEIKKFPGRRGVQQFNNAMVDGELSRLELIEEKYTRPFIRSSIPIYTFINALWEHPALEMDENEPIAYTLGVAWQENFVSENPDHTFIRLPSDKKTIKAYNRGVVGRFLTVKQLVRFKAEKLQITPVPTLVKVISSLPLYHYLDIKYSRFMSDFSAEIQTHNSFSEMQ